MTEDEYDQLNSLDWFEYEFATIEYDYQLMPKLALRIRNIAKSLYNNAFKEGKEVGDYMEGWQEGFKAARTQTMGSDE